MAILKFDILYLAVGAVIGAYLRYRIANHEIYIMGVPIAVMSVNILGSLILGATMTSAQRYGLSQSYVLFLGVGFCGSFTTMSSFAFETVSLLGAKETIIAFANVVFNVGLSILGVLVGKALVGLVAP